jgi:proteasome lid subunit RPN8/RPN11
MFRAAFQGTVIRNEPAYRPRPAAMPGYHKFSHDDYDAFVAIDALEAIAARARAAAPNEMIGYLVGRPFRDARGLYAVVSAAIFAEAARCGPAAVETSLDDERGLLVTLQADHPLADRLGWFHSHPFFMPTYSPTDLENQRFWSEPYQLGLLACLDPAGGVSIFAFRGPAAEAIHPPFTTTPNPHPDRVPTFRTVQGAEHQDTTPETARPVQPKRGRRFGAALLRLAGGAVWPIVYLVGVWMVVQAIREGRDGADRPAAVARDGTGSSIDSSKDVPVERRPAARPVATPAGAAGPPTQRHQRPAIGDR